MESMKTANFSKFILTCLTAVGAVVFIGATAILIPGQPGAIYNHAVSVIVDYLP